MCVNTIKIINVCIVLVNCLLLLLLQLLFLEELVKMRVVPIKHFYVV